MSTSLLPSSEPAEWRELEAVIGEFVKNTLLPQNRLLSAFDFELCPPEWLDALAGAFGLRVWRVGWGEPLKRKMLGFGIMLNRRAGTRWAMDTILEVFAPGSHCVEWFEKENVRRGVLEVLYELEKSEEPATKEFHTFLSSVLREFKNTRTHVDLRYRQGFAQGVSRISILQDVVQLKKTTFSMQPSENFTAKRNTVGALRVFQLTSA